MKKIVSGMLLLASCSLTMVAPAGANDGLSQASVLGPQALHAVLLDIDHAGARLIAVGERGVVLLSDDNGLSWRQAPSPVSTTLTSVQFVDSSNGWAVGHSGVVLHSADAGVSWQVQLDGTQAAAIELHAAEHSGDAKRLASAQRLSADGADKPLLAINFSDAHNGIVVGAYGLALLTRDGGKTWQSKMGDLPNPRGLHYYAMARHHDKILIAGEQGLLLRSMDGGASFSALQGSYDGSYFAAAILPSGRLLVGGLRGKLFASDDDGTTFNAIDTPAPASLNAIRVEGEQLLLTNQAGMVLKGGLKDLKLEPIAVSEGLPLSAVTATPDGNLVAVGVAGAQRVAPSSLSKIAD